MTSIYHFLRLTRFNNLLVIGLTMCIFQLFVSKYLLISIEGNWETYSFQELVNQHIFGNTGFLLLMLSTLLIAAAGNIINDYFDVKADRVNKPDRLIVDRHIKRRWTMLFHWSFNAVGMLIALYLSYVHENWWLALIAFVSINTLWFYSAIYKRKLLSGNLMVAGLIAIIPIYVYIFNAPKIGVAGGLNSSDLFDAQPFILSVTMIVSGIAFIINLIREIIKDIADIRGDMYLKAATLPIRLGIKKAKIIIIALTIPLLALMVFYYLIVWVFDFDVVHGSTMGNALSFEPIHFNYFLPSIILALLLGVTSLITLLVSDKRRFLLLSSNFLKLAMLFGLISPLFL